MNPNYTLLAEITPSGISYGQASAEDLLRQAELSDDPLVHALAVTLAVKVKQVEHVEAAKRVLSREGFVHDFDEPIDRAVDRALDELDSYRDKFYNATSDCERVKEMLTDKITQIQVVLEQMNDGLSELPEQD